MDVKKYQEIPNLIGFFNRVLFQIYIYQDSFFCSMEAKMKFDYDFNRGRCFTFLYLIFFLFFLYPKGNKNL